MKNTLPLVSVVVPSYNHAKFVTTCIESIVNQSFKDFELIVVDDGSTDGSREILGSLANKYNFKLILQENMGLPKLFNNAIKNHCRGKYFTFCASDDYWMPEKLQKQVLFMEQNPEFPMCYGKGYAVDEENNLLHDYSEHLNKHLKGGHIFKDLLLINFHPPVNYLFNKKVFDDVGYYREDVFTEDLYMNLRISAKYPIGYIDDYLFCYRVIRDYKKKPLTIKSSLSHLKCINEYKDTEFYSDAMINWHFKNFILYSPYIKSKLYALTGMIRSARFIFNKLYVKAFIKLLLLWK